MLKRINWPKKISKEKVLLRMLFWIINDCPIPSACLESLARKQSYSYTRPIHVSWLLHRWEGDGSGSFRRDAHGVGRKGQTHPMNPGGWRCNWGCSQRPSHPALMILVVLGEFEERKNQKKGNWKFGKINKCKLSMKCKSNNKLRIPS